jgi:hypothetical protein
VGIGYTVGEGGQRSQCHSSGVVNIRDFILYCWSSQSLSAPLYYTLLRSTFLYSALTNLLYSALPYSRPLYSA